MTGFFAEKLAAESPPAPAPEAQTPAAWWRDGLQMPSGRPQIQSEPLRDAPGTLYHPQAAEVLSAQDTCPRCGSENYAEYLPDSSQGGVVLGKIRKCFDCRYPATAVPAPDAGGTAKSGKATRQAVSGSWGGEETFARAPRIL